MNRLICIVTILLLISPLSTIAFTTNANPTIGAADARDSVQAFINGDELGAAMNAAGVVPFLGDVPKMSSTIRKFITKYSGKTGDVAKALVEYLKYADESVKLGALDAVYDGAASALKNKGVLTSRIDTLVNEGIDLNKIRILLDNVYSGAWSPGISGDAAKNLEEHFAKHGKEFGLSGDPSDLIGKQQYVDLAVDLINKQTGMEKYYDVVHKTLGVYERSTKKFVAGNTDGQIATLFIRDAKDIDNNPDRFIRLV